MFSKGFLYRVVKSHDCVVKGYARNKVWYRASFEMKFGILKDKFKLKKIQSLYFVFEYWFRDIKG